MIKEFSSNTDVFFFLYLCYRQSSNLLTLSDSGVLESQEEMEFNISINIENDYTESEFADENASSSSFPVDASTSSYQEDALAAACLENASILSTGAAAGQDLHCQNEDTGIDELVTQRKKNDQDRKRKCSIEDVAADYFSKRSKELGNDSDGLLSFFKSLLPDIRKLPPHKIRLCKIKMMEIVNDLSEDN